MQGPFITTLLSRPPSLPASFAVYFFDRLLLAYQHSTFLVGAKEAPEFRIIVPNLAPKRAVDPSPQHCHAAEHIWLLRDPVESARSHVQATRAHAVMARRVARPPGV